MRIGSPAPAMNVAVILCASLLAGLFSLNAAFGSPELEVPERGFISSTPAETWEEGLLCGNGTIGANVLSRPREEAIIFTHERLFLPTGDPLMPPEEIGDRLFEIRRLIERGLYRQATELAFDLSGQRSFMYGDPFVPAFDLSIEMGSDGNVADYMRSVDFQSGEATVHWADDGGVYERRMFVSRADGVAVLLIEGSREGSVDCRLKLEPRQPGEKLPERKRKSSSRRFENHITDIKTTADGSTLTFRNGFEDTYPGSLRAVEGVARVVAKGGSTQPEGDALIVSGADRVLVLVDIELLYDPDRSHMDETKDSLADISEDYKTLLQRHRRVHGELFNRVRLDIGGEERNLTTEELLDRTSNEDLSETLVEKVFDAGRYNIISSTGELPPNLQGVWAGTYSPSWASDYTHNGNVPSAIASMLMGNTPELMRAYTSYIEFLEPYLEINAEHMFGARGVVLPSRSTTHGFNNALAPKFAGGFWVAGAPWASHFFYDYYLYTGNRSFLAEHALPFMEKTALFFEDYLYEGPDGQYVFNPTQSPENTPGNTRSQGSFNATMAVASVKELLRNLIAASRELGVNEKKIPRWRKMLGKMPDYMISEDGVAKEWLTPKLEDRLSHRHSSQLYPVFYGMQKEIAADPELQSAFRRIIEIKLDRHYSRSSFMSFGLVQLGQAATSLGESELAYRCLVQLVNRYWLDNLASMHNKKSLLNMDVSGGLPAVVIKMLVSSRPGEIRLLPALPAAWPSGTIEGVLCRGQIEIKRLTWDGRDIRVELESDRKQTVTLNLPSSIENLSITEGNASVQKADRENCRRVSLPAGKPVILDIEMK